jgi:lipopolysaccharide transport system ATP-binding protein
MGEVASEGRTVIFVSHNMALVQTLCQRGIFLERGALRFDGPIEETVALYLRDLERALATDVAERTDRRGKQAVKLLRVEVHAGSDGVGVPATGRSLSFTFLTTPHRISTSCRFTIFDNLGNPVAEFRSAVESASDEVGEQERFVCTIDELPLVPGRYRIDVELRVGERLEDGLESAAMFDVEEGVYAGRPIDQGWSQGVVAISHRWSAPA